MTTDLRLRLCAIRIALVYAGLLAVVVSVSACATRPFDTDNVTVKQLPIEALRDGSTSTGTVLWGGVIVGSANLADVTQIEVLSYPLDYVQYPDTNRTAAGRFLIRHSGYLETADFAPGRRLTIVGQLDGTETGTVGETEYEYVRVVSEHLHLWSPGEHRGRGGLSIGLGIDLSN